MTTYQINYTTVEDVPVTIFLNSDESIFETKKRFVTEKADEVEIIDSCVDLGKLLTEEEIKNRMKEFHTIQNMKEWFSLYFNSK